MVLDPSFPEPEMPRTARASAANYCYHVLNRGNHRAQVFHKDDDYQAFDNLLPEASLRVPMRVLAFCLMPIISTWSSGPRLTAISVAGIPGIPYRILWR